MGSSDLDSAARSLQAGQTLLAQGQAEAALPLLLAARDDAAQGDADTRLQAHNLIERHGLPGAFSAWMGVCCEISPRDDIYRFFDGHPTSVNPLRDYFADGWRTMSELMLLLESVQRPLLGAGSFLEFASGHGRFTRHLVKALGAQRVTVSDVVSDAVAFAQQALGAAGFVSTARPQDLAWPQRHDVVFVLSLFSHLPRATWAAWLRRLWDAVAPGGVLVFTTHGDFAAQRAGVTLDEQGFHFVGASESTAIDVQEYGTAFTSEAFVLQRMAETCGTDALVHRAAVHFWNHQDAYVLRRA